MAKKSIVSPKGVLMYAFVARTDKKYKKEHGEFRINEVLPLNDTSRAIVAAVDTRIQELVAEKKAAKLKDDPKFKGKIRVSPDRPYEINEEEGTVTLKFKRPGAYKDKDTGTMVPVTITVFSGDGKPMPKEQQLKMGNGSEGQVSYWLHDYDVEAKGVGVSLRFGAVMVHKYVEYTGGDAESYGFDIEESGGEDSTTEGAEAPVASDDDDGSGDF